MVFAYQFLSGGRGEGFNVPESKFIILLPPTWFVEFFFRWIGWDKIIPDFAFALFIAVSLMFALFVPITLLEIDTLKKIIEPELHQKSTETNKLRKFLSNVITSLFFKSKTKLAFYSLVYTYLKRDRAIRMRILPTIAITLAVALYLYLFSEFPEPLHLPLSRANLLVMFTILFTANISTISITTSRDYRASWVYHFVRNKWLKLALSGSYKVIVHHIFIPVILIAFILFALKLNFKLAVVHSLLTFAFAKLYFDTAFYINSYLPFSQPDEKISSMEKIAIGFLPLPFVLLFGFVEAVLYRLNIALYGALILLGVGKVLSFLMSKKVKVKF